MEACLGPFVQTDALDRNLLEEKLRWVERRSGDGGVSSAIYSKLLRECGDSKSLSQGRRVHRHIIDCGRARETYLGNFLIEMYGKCGEVEEAREVFETISPRNVFSWNLMIAAYARLGYYRDAFHVFRRIDLEGVRPSRVTFLGVLDCCSTLGELPVGEEAHARIVEGGFAGDLVVATALINMYGRCSITPAKARSVFEGTESRDLVSWNAIIVVYAQRGEFREAVRLYREMQLQGVSPDKFHLCSVIFACSSCVEMAAEGRIVHQRVRETGVENELVIGNALVHMYGKHGDVKAARRVFDGMRRRDTISWTSMIVAYSQRGEARAALELLMMMNRGEVTQVRLDKKGFTSVIDVCSKLAAVEEGRAIHAMAVEQGLELDTGVGSSLVDMYGKCGCLREAEELFARIKVRDMYAWASMLGAYAQAGEKHEAFRLFQRMDLEGAAPDAISIIIVLSVCSGSSHLTIGRTIHSSIRGSGMEFQELVATALVDMYGRCGRLQSARSLFDAIPGKQDVFLWSALISGHSQHGDWEESVRLFREMQVEGVEPDEWTVTSVLSAFSHGGLIDQANEWLVTLVQANGVRLVCNHYTCMLDLLGRAGCLEDAEEVMKRMPVKPNAVAWTTLMGSCSTHGDVRRGAAAAVHAQEEDSSSSAGYVSMRNIYIP